MKKRFSRFTIPAALVILGALAHGVGYAAEFGAIPIQKPVQKNIPAPDETEMLRRENARLKEQVTSLKQQVESLTRNIEQMRQDKPFCKTQNMSANKAGATRDCTPYACDPVPGTCLNRCATTLDCAGGAVCDVPAGLCIYMR